MAPGAGKTKHMSRKCNNCYISGDEKQLFACSRCRSQYYCSKECQKGDWKNHKTICQNNGLLESRLKEHESTALGMMDRLMLVDGISMYELDQRLEKWVKFHNSTLMAATIQALRLPVDISRARTHVLYILLEPRPASEHNDQAGKFFRALEAEVIAIEDAMRKESPWPESLMQLNGMADDMERSGHGTVAAAMIECPPLAVQTVPFGSMSQRALRSEILRDTWKSFFMQHIEQGARPKLVRARPGGRG
ncbi:hypothetical protein BD311DRAFT_695933 [Dichomitus squalens]|uniref:MYND-type domain-containing protein n=1 Tax=Dichomitus squalens TaxID=114155 RepID=A0A4Q9MJP2_9APHY|nr:hypothetical protein BD311DRAFT_695933 [Dichomitus squalens]